MAVQFDDPPAKKSPFAGESVVPVKKIDNLPVELLDFLVKFVPQIYDLDTRLSYGMDSAHGASKRSLDITDVKIWTQFNLRLLSRKWAAVITAPTVSLKCEEGRLLFCRGTTKRSRFIMSRLKAEMDGNDVVDVLTDEALSDLGGHSLVDRVGLLDVYAGETEESVEDVLTALSSVVPQPCLLELSLHRDSFEGLDSFVSYLNTPFQLAFPGLSLRKLDYGVSETYGSTCRPLARGLRYYLSAATNLVELIVHWRVFKAAFELWGPAFTQWTCVSLRKMKIDCQQPEDDDEPYDFDDINERQNMFAFQANFPRWFPNLEKLSFECVDDSDRVQIDFGVLGQMQRLTSLSCPSALSNGDFNLAVLPQIETLSLAACTSSAFQVSVYAPSVVMFKLSVEHPTAFAQFAAELHHAATGTVLERLQDLRISFINGPVPSFEDLSKLLLSLDHLPRLSALTINCSFDQTPWPRAGDLSLLRMLPHRLTSLSLAGALVPNDCELGADKKWHMPRLADDPNSASTSYKDWLCYLLRRISDIPALEKVSCRCVAPNFDVIMTLASAWNNSAADALSDIGLSCVSHVQAAVYYQRTLAEGPLNSSDDAISFVFRLRFRKLSMMSITDYLHRVSVYLEYENWGGGMELAKLFSSRDQHVMIEQIQSDNVARPLIRRYVSAPFDQLVALHVKCVAAVCARKYEQAYHGQVQLIQILTKEVIQKRKDENWFLPICYSVCTDLRLFARLADQVPVIHRDEEDSSSCYEKAAAPIMEIYRNCVSDVKTVNIETSKRLCILNLTNQLFRIYFKINKLNLLKPLIRTIDNCGPLYDYFSMADKVTYKYYTGRRAMFESEFQIAETALSFAFKNCPQTSQHNKRLILMYLIPVKMFLGHMPTEALLRRYDLAEFSEVAQAVRQGNLLKLERALETYEPFFIKCGIFLMLEKLKIITYRTLFKKVCLILETHQVPLEAFVVALKFQNVDDVDSAEVACILANLIYQGKIKGYISHQHQKLVISKQNAFPTLSSVAST